MKLAAVLLLSTAMAGCGNPVNLRTAANYYDAAVAAELAGNFALAERNYDRALLNARLGHAPDSGISAALYGLGRMKGYQCNFTEAEPLLVESLKLEESVTGPESELTTKRLFELARYYFDQGKFNQSTPYYARGIPAVRRLGMESSDPIALAGALDEYAIALGRSGNAIEAGHAKSQADQLRNKNPGKRAVFVPTRYGSKCPKVA